MTQNKKVTSPTSTPVTFSHHQVDISPLVTFYSNGPLDAGVRLEDEEYARARSNMLTFCLDAVPCGRLKNGTPAIALVTRAAVGQRSGPFRNEPWIVGGRWDMQTPWEEFIVGKLKGELLGGQTELQVQIDGLVSPKLFATGWAANTDGPFGYQGLTLQYCYRAIIGTPLDELVMKPDRDHSEVTLLTAASPLPALHPYIAEVIKLSAWLES